MLTKEQLKNYGKVIKSKFPKKGRKDSLIILLVITESDLTYIVVRFK